MHHPTRARLLSNSAKNAGSWITTLPFTKELTISDVNFRLAVRLRLGLPPQDDLPKCCPCSVELTSELDHFLSCTRLRRSAATTRHDMLVRLLDRFIRRAGGATYVEPNWLGGQRPDIHVCFPDSRYLLDASVTHPAAPSYCRASAFTLLHAATDREKRKTTKYKALATEEGSAFVPFVMETYGGFGPKAGRFLGDLVRRASHLSSSPYPLSFRDYATRALSVCLVNGNCFVQQMGCLRTRELDGKFRRDRRRQEGVSPRLRHSILHVAPSLPPPPPSPEVPRLQVHLTLIPDDDEARASSPDTDPFT